MSLYTEQDNLLLIEKVEDIMKNADQLSGTLVEPTKDKMWEIVYTVRDFVIEKKRKIYGGFALNKLIENRNPKDAFYADDNVKDWDIDFYSPDPINDAKEIADRLRKKGFEHVVAREAQHDETYKVFAETLDCADISYVPSNIYRNMPFNEVNGLCLTGPHFMMIDYFRILTDPLTSYFRLEKTFTRLCLMLKYFPLPTSTSSITIIPPNNEMDVAFRTVNEFLIDRSTTVTVGMYAYNHLIKESGIINQVKNQDKLKRQAKTNKTSKNDKSVNINYVDINYYEIISTNYVQDVKDLINKLYDKVHSKERITYVENYPFLQYLGYSVDIYFDDEIICKIYHYNRRCTPFFDVPSLYFKNDKYEKMDGKIRIGTVAVQMMYNLINIMKARSARDDETKDIYYTMISHIIQMKDYFFSKNNKTIFDDTLFKEFVLNCVGKTTTPQMEKAERMEKKKKAGKKYMWNYNPENDKDKENVTKYFFKNSSGNRINNPKNYKIDMSVASIGDVDDINDEIDDDI